LYELRFGKKANKVWGKLDTAVKRQLQKKLAQVLENPHIPSMRMREYPNSYRIKLRKAGVRLGYRVYDDVLIVMVIAIGQRDKEEIYEDFGKHYNQGY
jgi:mRNA interferase RelE/StbE